MTDEMLQSIHARLVADLQARPLREPMPSMSPLCASDLEGSALRRSPDAGERGESDTQAALDVSDPLTLDRVLLGELGRRLDKAEESYTLQCHVPATPRRRRWRDL